MGVVYGGWAGVGEYNCSVNISTIFTINNPELLKFRNHSIRANQCDIQVVSSEDYMFIESFESRQSDEWVDLIKTLNRESRRSCFMS